MSILSQLYPVVFERAKRKGRGLGSGKGSKSGRGTTRHQKARTSIPLHFEGGQGRVVKKYPLLRGKSKNKSVRPKPYTVQLSHLEAAFKNEPLTTEYLVAQGYIDAGALANGLKVVYDKPIKVPIKIALACSAQVKKAIESVGGSVITS